MLDVEYQRFLALVGETLAVDAVSVSPDADLKRDLGLDSLDILELVILIETESGVQLAGEGLQYITTLADAYALWSSGKPGT